MSDDAPEGFGPVEAARLAELQRLGTLRDGAGADLTAERRRLEKARLVHERYQAQQSEAARPGHLRPGDFRPTTAAQPPPEPKPPRATGKGRTAPASPATPPATFRPKARPTASPKKRDGRL